MYIHFIYVFFPLFFLNVHVCTCIVIYVQFIHFVVVCARISLYMLIESLYHKCRLQILVSRNNLGIPLGTNTNRTEIEYKRYTNTHRICTTYEVKTMRNSGN